MKLNRKKRQTERALLHGKLSFDAELLEILVDKPLMARIRQGIREVKQGKVIPWERAKQKLKRAGA